MIENQDTLEGRVRAALERLEALDAELGQAPRCDPQTGIELDAQQYRQWRSDALNRRVVLLKGYREAKARARRAKQVEGDL